MEERVKDKTVAQLISEAKRNLILARKELEERLIFKSQHGNRVRATVKDRAAGEAVVAANRENTKKIIELKQRIKKLEKFLR